MADTSKREELIEALAAGVHEGDGWMSDAQNAQLEWDGPNRVIHFCGQGSIDVGHLAAIAEAVFEQAQAEDVENTTPEGIEVKPGQRWRSLDKRDHGRTVTVESVGAGKARVTSGVTRSTLSVRRMRRMSTGWELIGGGA